MENLRVFCGAERPWLGDVGHAEARCGKALRVLQRGASNVYFPHVASSIYLPLWGEQSERPIVDALEDPTIWTLLKDGLDDGRVSIERCQIVCQAFAWRRLDAEGLRMAAQRKLDGDTAATNRLGPGAIADRAAEEERYRRDEYQALQAGRGNVHTDLSTVRKDAAEYDSPISHYFSAITLVEKLRETRALYGFSRYLPDDGRTYRDQIDDLRLDPALNWLPAVVVRGEGIFFEMDSDRLGRWIDADPMVTRRIGQLADQYNAVRESRSQSARVITPKFVLLHTLAHLIINQLSFDCGYGSSSLRERIYCDMQYPDHPMNGFLIYTASGDAEGTMGGLVRQGQPGRLEEVLLRALRSGIWCSYDPICMESGGQGPDSCNLAACHGCGVLPETSCEEGNRLLDRAMVVGLPVQTTLGLFGQFVQRKLELSRGPD